MTELEQSVIRWTSGAVRGCRAVLGCTVVGTVLGTVVGAALGLAVSTALSPAIAQDVARGAQLFQRTGATTGKQVGNCVACHANQDALREMLRNRNAKPDDARAVGVLLQRAIDGAQPGATNAKAQYRSVLSERDVKDLAAYIARAARS